MQRWEQKQKQKNHQIKVENAKSSLRRYSNSRQRPVNTSRGNNTSNFRPSITPINKILQIFQLEQYAPLLASYGYPNKLIKKKSLEYLDQMMEEVAEKDKQKFLSLLNTLAVMSKDIKKQTKTPKSASKNTKIHYPPPSTSLQAKQSPNSVQKSEKTTIKFRVKQKTTIQTSLANKNKASLTNQQPEDITRKSNKTRQNSVTTDKRRKKSLSHTQSKATDDLTLIHDFVLGNNQNNESGMLRPINESNKIVQKLTQKLNILEPKKSSQGATEDLKLQMQKIKNMYLSFDSATMSSNIINIDLHQMIQCLALQIKQLMLNAQITHLAKSRTDQIKSLLHQSFIFTKQESCKSRDLQPTQYLPQQLEAKNSLQLLQQQSQNDKGQDNPSIQKLNVMKQIDYFDAENRNLDQYLTDQSSQQIQDENCSIDLDKGMKESSLWGNSYIASIINDFSCFDYIYEDPIKKQPPQHQDIKNFIELVVMAGRMQKQVPIIAFVYLQRLLAIRTVKQAKITGKNWKNLVLVTLIQASKIWDDQSLQNHSFAKLIKPYSTLQINRLQKYLVYFLDYRLTIDQKQYSEAYFKLRKHVGEKQSAQSANLMRLDLKTILKFQQAGNEGNKKNMDKKQFFKKLLNKSF